MREALAVLGALTLAALGLVAYLRGRAAHPAPKPTRTAADLLVRQAERLAEVDRRAAEQAARAKLEAAERKAVEDAKAKARDSGGLAAYLRARNRGDR